MLYIDSVETPSTSSSETVSTDSPTTTTITTTPTSFPSLPSFSHAFSDVVVLPGDCNLYHEFDFGNPRTPLLQFVPGPWSRKRIVAYINRQGKYYDMRLVLEKVTLQAVAAASSSSSTDDSKFVLQGTFWLHQISDKQMYFS